jgi:uncharacterized repeat protein (TIGR01451 family)
MKYLTPIGSRMKTHLLLGLLVAGLGVIVVVSLASLRAAPPAITLVAFETDFTNPIGIDFHPDVLHSENGIGDLIISANYPTGQPHNLDLIQVPSGTHAQFSNLNGLTEELKIASARIAPGCQQFPVGDVFTGTGKPGEIVRVDQGGNFYPTVSGGPVGGGNSWVQLPGVGDLLRGSLYVDRTCIFGGDLIVVTGSTAVTGGDIWRVNVNGIPTHVADVGPGTHLEGVITVPCSVSPPPGQPCPANDPVWGPWAGTILAGNESGDGTHVPRSAPDNLATDGLVFSITPGGVATAYDLSFTDASGVHHPMKPEDLDLIDPGNSFFGVNYGNQRVLTASKADFTTFANKILLTQEYPCGSALAVPGGGLLSSAPCTGAAPGSHATTGLYVLSFVGTGGNAAGGLISVTPLTSDGGISNIDQWEHVTFAPLGNPHLKVVKTPDNGTFSFQGQASFTIVVSNNGFDVATNVQLTDNLPGNGGLTWITATTTQGTCALAANVLNCSLGALAPGASATITVSSAATTPAAACTNQPNPAAIATADGGLTAQDGGSLTCTPPPSLGHGDTATIGFWHNQNGQALITCVNGGSSSTALGNYLATTYPSLFGAGAGSLGNLAGKTNAQIAAIYLGSTYFGVKGMKVNAQVLAVALATYVTSSTLSGGNCAAGFGFNVSADGTGVKTYNVGSDGHLLGPGFVDNGSYTIFQLLAGANAAKAAGTFDANAWNDVFNGINESGDIS